METTAHYTRVGFFVLGFSLLLIIGALWLSVGLSGKTYKTYKVYMYESVSGLSVKAPVKYNGVEIGSVTDISLYPKNPKKVQLLLSIETDMPIYNGVRATLQTQGLTGLAFLELKGGMVSKGLLQTKTGQSYPEIPSAPSLFFRLDSALDDLTDNIREISTSLRDFLNPQNATAVKNTLQNFSALSEDLKHNSQKLDAMMNNAQVTLKNTAKASQDLPALMLNMRRSSEALASSANEAKIMLSNGSSTMNTVNSQVMPQIIDAMSQVQDIMSNVKSITQQMSTDPAVIIRGKVTPPLGPGE
jgi:phospholipid/cholesterol/gamma-HCH transport system substrate-binding protein